MDDKVYSINEIKTILKENLKDFPVYKVVLFGSYAKNNADKFSDLDFLVDTKGKLRGFAFLDFQCKMENLFKKKVDAFENYEIIKDSKVDKEIKNTGVVVYERNMC